MSTPACAARFLAPALQGSLVVIGTAPLWALSLEQVPAFHSLSDLLGRWFCFQCERDPARTLVLLGHALPVCARCSGIYLGLAAGALIVRPRLHVATLRVWLLVASALMLLDVLSEAWGFRPGSASLRLATGLLFAYPVGVALALWIRDRIRDRATAESRSRCSAPSTSG